MAFPYRRILCPVDFDDNSFAALDVAAEIARHTDGAIFVLHVVPMIVPPVGTPVYVDIYKSQEETAWAKLREIGRRNLAGARHELLVQMGDPAGTILRAQKKIGPDVLVMATRGRRGFSRFFLGSVAETVLREAACPVLTVRAALSGKHMVGAWMTHDAVTVAPDEKLSLVESKLREGAFRSMPVVKDGQLLGIITDRDLRRHAGFLEQTEVRQAMTGDLITVAPSTSVREAARLMRERKIGGLPVVEEGKLVGIITTSDVLRAFSEGEAA